jgi:hypothetical protein
MPNRDQFGRSPCKINHVKAAGLGLCGLSGCLERTQPRSIPSPPTGFEVRPNNETKTKVNNKLLCFSVQTGTLTGTSPNEPYHASSLIALAVTSATKSIALIMITSLHVASQTGHLDVARLLIDRENSAVSGFGERSSGRGAAADRQGCRRRQASQRW